MPEPHPQAASSSAPARLFFVYGTLRRGGANDITHLVPAPQWVGAARIAGVMVHLDGYPGVTLGRSDAHSDAAQCHIVGEVYAVSAELEAQLDAIESEYPASQDEYAKRAITVLVDGQPLACSIYEINPVYAVGKPVIASGDWMVDGVSLRPPNR